MAIIYLRNQDILEEIHLSKNSYSSFTQPEYNRYDLIVNSIDEIIPNMFIAKQKRAEKLSQLIYEAKKAAGEKVKQSECAINYTTIPDNDIVFRVMTYDHIPLNNTRKKNPKNAQDFRDKVNFPPFQHWKLIDNELVCVGKSHWKGPVDTGSFSKDHGQITNNLALMFMKLCERYASRGNVRNYTYVDEMQGQAILQLTQIGLQFDESKSDNPFSYFTSVTSNVFIRVINQEKRNQDIRDDLLELNGMNPSYTRLGDNDFSSSMNRGEMDNDY